MFFHKPGLFEKPLSLIAMAAGAGIVIGCIASLAMPPRVESSRSFIVGNARHAAQGTYDYEGYYTLQTANEAAKSLVSWLTSPGGVEAVYREAGIAKIFPSLKSYERAFAIRRDDTPFFEVRYDAKTQKDAERLSASLEKLLRQELSVFQRSDSLALDAAPLVAVSRSAPYARNIAYGALLAGALAAFLVLFRLALRENG